MGQTKKHRYEFYVETGGEMKYKEAKSDTNKSSEEEETFPF